MKSNSKLKRLLKKHLQHLFTLKKDSEEYKQEKIICDIFAKELKRRNEEELKQKYCY